MDTPTTPYLGDQIVWKFADDAERASYKAQKRPVVTGPQIYVFALIIVICATFIYEIMPLWNTLLMVVLLIAPVVLGIVFTRRVAPKSVELQLRPGYLSLIERRDTSIWIRDVRFGPYRPRRIKSARWLSDGCYLEMKRVLTSQETVLLPIGLFKDLESLEALYRWAIVHGIEIEGVPPLPGGYVRPIEERRGL